MRNDDHDGMGERSTTPEYIGHAVALLHGKPRFEPSVTRGRCRVCAAAADRRVDYGYDVLIKSLRTHGVDRLRLVLVDRGQQIFPLPENLYHASTTYRSLSRREADVLQMIARGMSNKCIARSLGIAPETVKTHVKSILSKLKARTRAQAVARAETLACFTRAHLLDETLARVGYPMAASVRAAEAKTESRTARCRRKLSARAPPVNYEEASVSY
jgi:DNA-binding CsgD family transcriptional regulator